MGVGQRLRQRLKSAVHLNWEIGPTLAVLNWTHLPWTSSKWTQHLTIILHLKKAFQRCEGLFLWNDFMLMVIMLKKFSSTDNVIDRNSVRNAEAFKKSRLLFREDSTEIADEAAPWTKNKKPKFHSRRKVRPIYLLLESLLKTLPCTCWA